MEMKAPPFSIIGQFLKDLSFENVLFTQMKQLDVKGTPKIETNANVFIKTLDENERVFEVTLVVNAEAVEDETKFFIVEMTYAAIVQINPEIDVAHIDPILNIEVPYYLFLFEIRNICANMTSLGSFPPLFLNPVDFSAIYQEKAVESAQMH